MDAISRHRSQVWMAEYLLKVWGEGTMTARLTQKEAKRLGLTKRKAPACPTEHDEQKALIAWAERESERIPQLRLLFAIANAGAGAQRGQAGKMKAEGVKAGVPDLMLPVMKYIGTGILDRSLEYAGCFIEMKRQRGGTVSPEQSKWHEWLIDEGYCVVVCKGAEEAKRVILEYLG